ncbi:hypothetical protein WR25_07338 [Diploscapter pachys]|uniref:Reverse transcriptase domain-containing protein n=1 Tax=Diploscapter pachys TaxID=2018661 RepID=A0A2A2KB76_9BILA|nr:hypothetical protein WR25_07338 [Diploscapter pachys]
MHRNPLNLHIQIRHWQMCLILQAFVLMAFVGGLQSDDIRRRLLEKEEEITPEQALESAEAFERVLRNTKNLNKHESQSNGHVAYVQKQANFNGHEPRKMNKFNPQRKLSNTRYFERNRNSKSDYRGRSRSGSRTGFNGNPRFQNGKPQWTNKPNFGQNAYKPRRFEPKHQMKRSKSRVGFVEYENQDAYQNDYPHQRNDGYDTDSRNGTSTEDTCLNVNDEEEVMEMTSKKKDKNVRYYKIYPRPVLHIVVNGKEIKFELDTGAVMSIIGTQTWQTLGCPKLKKVDYEAATFNGQNVPFKGIFEASISLNGIHKKIFLHVVDGCVASLCGRDMLVALKVDCGPHFSVNEISIHEESQENDQIQDQHEKLENPVNSAENMSMLQVRDALTEILSENSEVFKSELGKCTMKKATLKFKGPIESKFHRARPVPHALKPKVDMAIDEMVKKGIWEKVNHPKEFVTPLVIVPKTNGSVRICGDFKVTVNPYLDIDQHPLPKPDDVFHALVGGKKFSKMDLSEAYMQVEMDEKSKDYLMVNTHKGLYRYNRLPFGIASAPAIFQEIMDNVLAGMDGVMVYLDDIIITAKSDNCASSTIPRNNGQRPSRHGWCNGVLG